MRVEHITAEATLSDPVRKADAWKVLTDFTKYPAYSRNIDKIIISDKKSMEQLSEWDVTFDGAPLNWIQKDLLDADNYSVNFHAVGGDFDEFSGTLYVEDSDTACIAIHYAASYRLGIPIIEDLFGPVFREKMESNFTVMVRGLANELRTYRVDDRQDRRYPIGVTETLRLDGGAVRATIVNLSRNGIMFACDTEPETPNSLNLLGLNIGTGAMHAEPFGGRYRLLFTNPLENAQLERLVSQLQSRHVRPFGAPLVLEPKTVIYS